MNRLFAVFALTAVVAVSGSAVSAQGMKAKAMSAQGSVAAVAADSLTVKGANAEWMFMIDKDTQVVAKGATHKSMSMKADGKSSMLTDFVKMGDRVTVAYHDMGTMKHASMITVTSPSAMK